jgi:GWxTD domain-containing protein
MLHEQEHARRRDPLIQWIALANRAVFWFHPLAWWLERHLAELAEDACDTVVLSKGHQPTEYCEYLLSMARAVTRAGARLNVVGAAMPGAVLSQRIRRILGSAPESRLSSSRLALTLAACAAASVALIAGTLATDAQPQPGSPQSVAGQPLSEFWFEDDEWHLETAPLMSASEMDRYQGLRTVTDRDTFISDFWTRHDPTRGTSANEFRREFERRIRYAKEHYANPDSAATFGYQTDRGRWYVMSGQPDAVRVFGTRRVDANGRPGEIEEWDYHSLDDLGSNVSIRFDLASNVGCTYRGGKYRIVSPSPVMRFDGVTSAGSDRRPYAQIYPGHFVYLSFPIDAQAVAIRWGMRAGPDGQLILDEDTAPIDYVQGEIGSVADDPARPTPGRSRPPQPILEHLQGLQFFEPGGIACTEQLPPATYTLKIESRLTNGALRTDSVTFTVE